VEQRLLEGEGEGLGVVVGMRGGLVWGGRREEEGRRRS